MPVLLSPSLPPAASPDAGWRARNLGALLFAATGRCVSIKLQVVQVDGSAPITGAQLALFNHLDRGGTRLTALAARAGLSKQAMIELIDRAEATGMVLRRPDSTDRRAKKVHLTAQGLLALDRLRIGVAAAEESVRQAFGTDFLGQAREALWRYATGDAVAAAPLAELAGGEEERWRTRNVARLFATSARRFSREALIRVGADDRPGVGEVSLPLFRNLDLRGSRLTDIAVRARMTKQSMRELVGRAEATGLVERRPDPDDGRAKIVAFTPAGRLLLEEVRRGLALAEERFAAGNGAAFTARLKDRLASYAAV